MIIFFYDGNHVLAITELASEKIFYEELIAILAIFRQVFKNDEIWFEIFGVGEKDEVKLALYVLAVIRWWAKWFQLFGLVKCESLVSDIYGFGR